MARLKNIHPGEVLREEFLTPLGITAYQLAKAIRVPQQRLSPILNEKSGISPKMALRLAVYFRTSPQFWLNLQDAYDLEAARESIGDGLAAITPVPGAVEA
jgi:addiction module HigA family antidote